MPDYSDFMTTLDLFTDSQDVEQDNRQRAIEANNFLDDRDGQWEQDAIQRTRGQPRYTFDLTNPIVDEIGGEIEKANFGIIIKPSGGETTDDDAMVMDGKIRDIESRSGAKEIYSTAGKKMVGAGIAGWRVKQQYIDGNSFNQELVVAPIEDFANRVWFDPSAKHQTKRDSRYAFIVNPIGENEVEEKFPNLDRDIVSVSQGNYYYRYYGYRAKDVFIGQIYYKVERERTLVLMSNGEVYEDDDKFKKTKDELAKQEPSVVELDRRKRKINEVKTRLFDAAGWLNVEQDTVFQWIPLIPCYGNYKIDFNKTKYRGVVEKLLDPQRVLNYSLSREVAEGALAPRAKYWMTRDQAKGEMDTLRTLNTNQDPVQFFTADEKLPGPPQQGGGAQINPGLRTISTSMQELMGSVANMFAANMGDNPGLQSGVAIKELKESGNTGNEGYFKSMEIAICHTAVILVDGVPKVHDTEQQFSLLKEDGTREAVFVNKRVRDEQTDEMVILNDLSRGAFDVTCSAGPSWDTRQEQTMAGIVELSVVDPTVMQLGGDILLNSARFIGSDQIAERKRAMLFDQGLIPIEQMTDEEKQLTIQQMQAAAQQQEQPDPLMVAAQAELIKAQNEETKTAISVQEKQANIQLAQNKILILANTERRKAANAAAQTQQAGAQLSLDAQSQRFSQFMDAQKQQMDKNAAAIDGLANLVKTLVDLQTAAQGPVVGPGTIPAVANQYEIVDEAQDGAESALTRLLPNGRPI